MEFSVNNVKIIVCLASSEKKVCSINDRKKLACYGEKYYYKNFRLTLLTFQSIVESV